MLTDKNILTYFYTNTGRINSNKTRQNTIPKDILDYLKNRYSDSSSIIETLYRIKHHIEDRPVCKECGGYVTFKDGKFCSFCCSKCSNKNKEKQNKSKKTCLIKYGNENYNNRDKYHQTCLEKYGLFSYTNREKCKQTKYERYGDPYYFNVEKLKNTIYNKYGVTNISQLDYIKEKKKQTCFVHNGVYYGWHTKEARKQAIIGLMNHYQSDLYSKNKELAIQKYGTPNNLNKIIDTRIKKYGYSNYFCNPVIQLHAEQLAHSEEANIKRVSTCIEKYNHTTYFGSELNKYTMSSIMSSVWMQEHINAVKKEHGTFNTSSTEDKTYFLLKERYPDVIRNYHSNIYPFNCDFYIPSIDLYIECNYHWTHNNHLFNPLNEKDLSIVNNWKNKNTKYYFNAINTWTNRDVQKYKTFIIQKLNFKWFYSYNDFLEWFNQNS